MEFAQVSYSDMQARVSLWCSLNNIGWPFPPREPLSKAELIEEERMREAMLEARKHAPAEDLQIPCRTIRALIGYKPMTMLSVRIIYLCMHFLDTID